MFIALLLSHKTCQKLHSVTKEWHLSGTKCTCSQSNATKFRWKRQILLSCQLQQNCCTGSCWHVPTRLELPKLTTLKMHHYSVLGRTRDVEASWPAMRYKHSFSNSLVHNTAMAGTSLAFGKCPCEAVRQQHSTWQGHFQLVLHFLSCHVTLGKLCHGLTLLLKTKPEKKSWGLKKDMS